MQLLLAAHDPAHQVRVADTAGMDALVLLAESGHSEGVRLLLAQPCVKEQVEAVDRYGFNALMTACHGRQVHVPCVKLLLAACGGSLAAAQCQATTK
jgi:hypothetical protein